MDGSAKSLGGLKRAIELAREFGGTVEAITVFDPYFHYAMFHSIAGVLCSKAQKVFRFKEQEKLHEEIIDSGLAKIYTAHLEIAKKIAEDEGVELKTTLLAGKPFEQTLKYVNEVNPTMVVMGRIGYHSDDEMDIGGNTENMMRYLPTNVLITNYEYQAPDLYTAEEHMTWTKEALERLDRIPGFVVGMATGAIIRYAIEKGYTVITTGVIDEVIKSILPPGAMESMRAIGDQMREAEAMGEDKPIDSLFKDFDERTADKANGSEANGHKNGANGSDAAAKQEIFEAGRGGFGKSEDQGDIEGVSAEVQEEIRRSAQGQDRFECDVCRYVAKGKPARCPVCGSGPTHFHAVDAEIATTAEDENLNLSEVYDGRELHWTDDATALLDSLEEWQEKRRVKARVEKSALKKGYTTITREYVEQQYREETGREAPEVKSGGCPVSHAKQQVQETSGRQVSHRPQRLPEGRRQRPRGRLHRVHLDRRRHRAPRACAQGLYAQHLAQHDREARPRARHDAHRPRPRRGLAHRSAHHDGGRHYRQGLHRRPREGHGREDRGRRRRGPAPADDRDDGLHHLRRGDAGRPAPRGVPRLRRPRRGLRTEVGFGLQASGFR